MDLSKLQMAQAGVPAACGRPTPEDGLQGLSSRWKKLFLGKILAFLYKASATWNSWLLKRSDLLEQPLKEPDWELYTGVGSFMENGQQWAWYKIVTIDQVIKAQILAIETWAQKAGLTALTTGLELSQGKNVNIYTDSKYAFMVVYAHGENENKECS